MTGCRFDRSTHVAQKNTTKQLKTTHVMDSALQYVSDKPSTNLNYTNLSKSQLSMMNMQV